MSEYIIRETGYPGTLKQEIVGELVRCKNCKWWEHGTCIRFGIRMSRAWDDYCSYGRERQREQVQSGAD